MDVGRKGPLRPSGPRGPATAAAVVLAAALVWATPSLADTTSVAGSTPQASSGSSAATAVQQSAEQLAAPVDKARAIRIARTDPKVAEERRAHGPLTASAQGKPGTWQVDFYANGVDRVQVVVDDVTGQISESWTGYQIA